MPKSLLYSIMKDYHEAQQRAMSKVEEMKGNFIYDNSDPVDVELETLELYPKLQKLNKPFERTIYIGLKRVLIMKPLTLHKMSYSTFEKMYPNWKEKENGVYKNLPNDAFILTRGPYDYIAIDNRKGKVSIDYKFHLGDCLYCFIK